MRVFKTKWFARYAKRAGIDDNTLCEAVRRAECGLVDADLGGSIIKQRISKGGQGRSKGHRTLIAYRCHKMAVFLYGFAKNERDNIDNDELASLKEIAAGLFKMNEKEIKHSLAEGHIQEVKYA